MATRLEVLAELDRRGKLPDGLRAAFEKAKRRGLVPSIRRERALPVGSIAAAITRPAQSLGRQALDVAKAAGAGVTRGVAQLTGLPGTLLELAGLPDEFSPFNTGAENETLFSETFGQATRGPESNFMERLAGRAGEIAGAGGPFVGAMAARTGMSAAQLAREALMGGAAALGGQATEEAGGGPTAQMVAEIASALAGPGILAGAGAGVRGLSRVSPLANAARFVGDRIAVARGRPPRPKDAAAAKESISAGLRERMTPRATAELAEAEALRRDFPGFAPGLARGTDVPSFKAQQARLDRELSGPALDEAAGRFDESVSALDRAVIAEAPAGEASDLMDAARAQFERAMSRNMRRREAAIGRARERAPRTTELQATGAGLRARLDEKARAAFKAYRARREAVGNDELDLGPLRQDVRDTIETTAMALRETSVPGVTVRLADEPRATANAPDVITAQELLDVDREINRQIRRSVAEPNRDQARLRNLIETKKAIRERIETLPQEQRDAYSAAQEFYATEVAPRFSRGASASARRKTAANDYRLSDEQVATVYFRPEAKGGVTEARRFNAVFGDDAEAQADLLAAAMDDLARTAVRDGMLDRGLYEGWTRKYGRVLDELPWIKNAAADADLAAQSAARRMAILKQRRKTVERSVLAGLVGQDPSRAVGAALNDPAKMRALATAASGSRAAEAGLRRAVWDALRGQANLRDAPTLEVFLRNNANTLRPALGDQHFGMLIRLSRAYQIQSRVPRPGGIGERAEGIAEGVSRNFLGTAPPQLASRLFAVSSKRTSMRFVVGEVAFRAMNARAKREADILWAEALENPEAAQALLDFIRDAVPSARATRRVYGFLFASGVGYVDRRREEPGTP